MTKQIRSLERSRKEPLFSVLTPSYRYARFIEECLDSVAAQQGPFEVEHIVADGGSTDGTVEILAARDNIEWFSRRDRGQSDALNQALCLSQGDIIGWLNADEYYLPGAFRRVRDEFISSGADVVFGDALFVDAAGQPIRRLTHHRFDRFVLRNYGCQMLTCAFFVRREILPKDPFDVEFRQIMDWDLYLRLAEMGARFHFTPHMLGAFRVHDDRVTAQPLQHTDTERTAIARRYGLPTSPTGMRLSRTAGHVWRIGRKTIEGAYLRQARTSARLKGGKIGIE